MKNKSFIRRLIENIIQDLFFDNVAKSMGIIVVSGIFFIVIGRLLEELEKRVISKIFMNAGISLLALFGLMILGVLIYFLVDWFQEIEAITREEMEEEKNAKN